MDLRLSGRLLKEIRKRSLEKGLELMYNRKKFFLHELRFSIYLFKKNTFFEQYFVHIYIIKTRRLAPFFLFLETKIMKCFT